LLYSDYYSGKYVQKIAASGNNGIDWVQFIIDTIEVSGWLSLRNDLPRVIANDAGYVYFFYYVNQNDRDTSGIYLYQFNSGYKKIDINIPHARYEYAIAPFVMTKNNVDHIYVAYYIDSSFYCIHSTDFGNTFSGPSKMFDLFLMWPPGYMVPKFQVDNSGKMYFYYFKEEHNFPMEFGKKHLVRTSTDDGLTWSEPILIDTNMLPIGFEIVGNKFVKYYNEDGNLYMQVSLDLINWSDKIRINTVDSTAISTVPAAVPYNDKIAFAWKDTRTGHDEIFYRLMDLETNVESETIPQDFVLYQNYPNPFNPVTNISFKIKNRALTTLKIYDLFGREVKVLVDQILEPNFYSYTFDGSNLSSGVYYYELTSNNSKITKKMLLLK
jgi:hypothetical protein